ncbi:MAG TPA: hypothetical protein VIV57_07505, partial [Anaeromyxobacter sp.]
PPTSARAPIAPPAAVPAAPARPAATAPGGPLATPPPAAVVPSAAHGLRAATAQILAQPSRKASAPSPAWPATVPGPAEAAEALCHAVASGAAPDGSPLAAIGDVLASLTDVERAVLAGEPQPIDPGPIRQAAVMRVRVAVALATAPQAGVAVDAAAVSALIAEIDALLSQVSALAEDAPEDLQASFEAVRNALVREAIDFSEAAHRAGPAVAANESAAPRPAAKARKTRLLPVDGGATKAGGRGLAVWIALGAVVALAAGYHGWEWHRRSEARAALSAGLPAGLTQIPGPPGGPRVLVRSSSTEAPDPADIARLKAVEEANGNKVRELDGMIFIEPATREAAPPAQPARP